MKVIATKAAVGLHITIVNNYFKHLHLS